MNKLLIQLVLFAVIVTGCSSGTAKYVCNKGICVHIEILDTVQALEPATYKIIVKTDKDISELGLSINGDALTVLLEMQDKPESAKLAYQDNRSMIWLLNTKGGMEYIFVGQLIFPKPSVSYGIFHETFLVTASHPSMARVTDYVIVYMDSSGKQVDENQAKELEGTGFPLPTPPPDLTVVPNTPFPTMVWPTETPIPSPTPEPTAYPPPESLAGTEPVSKNPPVATASQPVYPLP